MRVDHRQRLVEQDGGDVGAHQAAAERDLLLHVRRQPARLPVGDVGEVDQLQRLVHASLDLRLRHPAVAERKGQVLAHRHRVVDDGKLEHLRDVARLRRKRRDVRAVEQDAALGRRQQPRDDVQQRGLAATRRPQQRVGAAVLEGRMDLLQGVVRGAGVGMADVVEVDAGHQAATFRSVASERPSASKAIMRAMSAWKVILSPAW